MSWTEVVVKVKSDSAKLAETALFNAGASAVTFADSKDQPVYEPALGTTPLWQETEVIGLFHASCCTDEIINSLEEYFLPGQMPEYEVNHLADKIWEREWMQHFKPVQYSENFWVCPSWAKLETKATVLKLDPGLAFGTGAHPTTALCLQWLSQQPLHKAHIIDFGCGSGILGLAAILLGARKMTGIDIDPQALAATEENAKRNQISEDKVALYLPEQAMQIARAEYLIANILAEPLINLAQEIASLIKPDGAIALSGILVEQAEMVALHYCQHFKLNPIQTKGKWALITGTKRSQ